MKLIQSLYLNNRLFMASSLLAVVFILVFVFGGGLIIPQILFYVFLAVIFTDGILLFRVKRGLNGSRLAPDRLSNGDENEIKIHFENFYGAIAPTTPQSHRLTHRRFPRWPFLGFRWCF